MDAPPVQYARTSDGYNIAYCQAGVGQPIVLANQNFGHVEYSWRFYESWYQGLAKHFQLVWFDQRGHGLSDRGLPSDFSYRDYELDLESVLDASNVESPVLLGLGVHGHAMLRLAVRQAERVRALVLLTTSLSIRAWPISFHQDLSRENWEFFLKGLVPSGLSHKATEARLNEVKESCTPEDWQVTVRGILDSNIETDLLALKTPTLVLHPRHYRMLAAEEGRKVAARIPHARFVLIPGDTIHGDAPAGIAAIESFLADLPEVSQPTSEVATHHLSTREVEVLRLLAVGRSNQQIADELVISLNTVNRHVSNIYAKTGAANRAEAVGYAHRHGLAN
jgi:DNA-binding CsgD family transcriptional regulator/pimeloyl-ACP methyl ester carboxylesterase